MRKIKKMYSTIPDMLWLGRKCEVAAFSVQEVSHHTAQPYHERLPRFEANY